MNYTIFLTIFFVSFASFGKSPSPEDLKDPFLITLEQISKSSMRNLKIVDVRELDESSVSPVKVGTHKVETKPLSVLQKDNKQFEKLLSTVDKRKGEIIFVCANGARAKIARDYAARLGYKAKFASLVDYSKDYK